SAMRTQHRSWSTCVTTAVVTQTRHCAPQEPSCQGARMQVSSIPVSLDADLDSSVQPTWCGCPQVEVQGQTRDHSSCSPAYLQAVVGSLCPRCCRKWDARAL